MQMMSSRYMTLKRRRLDYHILFNSNSGIGQSYKVVQSKGSKQIHTINVRKYSDGIAAKANRVQSYDVESKLFRYCVPTDLRSLCMNT